MIGWLIDYGGLCVFAWLCVNLSEVQWWKYQQTRLCQRSSPGCTSETSYSASSTVSIHGIWISITTVVSLLPSVCDAQSIKAEILRALTTFRLNSFLWDWILLGNKVWAFSVVLSYTVSCLTHYWPQTWWESFCLFWLQFTDLHNEGSMLPLSQL